MIKKFISYYKPHKKLFAIDMICALVVSVCNLFYPRIAGMITGAISDSAKDPTIVVTWQFVVTWCVVLLGIFVLKAVLNYVIQYWGHVMGVRIQGDMRRDLFTHLESLPFNYFDDNKTGTIMSRLINDLMEVSELAHHGPEDVFLSFVTLIGAVIMIYFLNPYLALIAVVIIPLMCLFAIRQRLRMKDGFTEMRKETGEINANIESAVSGIRVSRAYTAEEHELVKFEERNQAFQKARNRAYKSMSVFNTGMGFFTDMLYLISLCSGALFYLFDKINVGDFTSYILYISIVISPIRTMTAIFESIQSGSTGFRRFMEIMNIDTEDQNPNAVEVGKLNGDIEFEHVSFSYHNNQSSSRLILDDVSFKLGAGKTVALVGQSGGGKTTICHLIPRFYEIDSGAIYVDGMNVKDITRKSLRKNIGIVQQDVFIFGGTIRDNIAYGNVDASFEEIVEAAKNAKIHDYVMTLPNGYDTEVGERGVKLSGGQKQRLSIARAFLKNPPILILDEATSALDNVTELQIQEALDSLAVGRTTLVVAHRLSTIKHADEIIVVTRDGIAERGTHEKLLAQNGIYAELYQKQFKDD